MTIRAVIDPGVLISALLGKGSPPDAIVQRWKRDRFELIVSPKLIAEFVEVISRAKFSSRILPEDIAEIVELLQHNATLQTDPPNTERFIDDPDDDYLAALAVETEADFLVSGDKALQRWSSEVVTVVSPREFLEQL
ncbi:MAG: putative toxin-antitoxin system toxin component, PIN family, partial [Acidimicrobiales bacterium]